MLKFFLMASTLLCSIYTFAADEIMPDKISVGDPEVGSSLVSTCAACHGSDGNSLNGSWPNLAGQNQKYTYDQLKYFQNGSRQNVLMSSVIEYLNSLTDEQLLGIAAFYESQSSNVGQATNDEELLALGEKLYRAGDLGKGIPACTACHSPNGAGNIQAGFPKVSGQQKGYLESTLKEYRSQKRDAGAYSLVMQSASANLTDRQVESLANYMHGLYEN